MVVRTCKKTTKIQSCFPLITPWKLWHLQRALGQGSWKIFHNIFQVIFLFREAHILLRTPLSLLLPPSLILSPKDKTKQKTSLPHSSWNSPATLNFFSVRKEKNPRKAEHRWRLNLLVLQRFSPCFHWRAVTCWEFRQWDSSYIMSTKWTLGLAWWLPTAITGILAPAIWGCSWKTFKS